MRLLVSLAAIAATAALAFVLLWFGTSSTSISPSVAPPAAPPQAVARQQSATPLEKTAPVELTITPTPKVAAAVPEDDPSLRPPQLQLEGLPPAWEQTVANAIAGQPKGSARARTLFSLLPRLPEEALAATAEEAVHNLPNADYTAVALPLVTDPLIHGQEMSVLFADLMERPDPIALPALLVIARNPSHPYAASALDNLKLILGKNHGTDWSKWDESVKRTLGAQRAPNTGR